MRRVLALVLLVTAAASLPFVVALGRAEAPAASPLSDVAWLAGHWVGSTPAGAYIEEVWMPERDGHMLGSFRWDRGQGRWLFEFMSIETGALSAAPLTLRLKHFDRGFRGFEDRTESTTFTSTTRTADTVVFELRQEARQVNLTYTRVGDSGLHVRFEETQPGQPVTRLEFPYTRRR